MCVTARGHHDPLICTCELFVLNLAQASLLALFTHFTAKLASAIVVRLGYAAAVHGARGCRDRRAPTLVSGGEDNLDSLVPQSADGSGDEQLIVRRWGLRMLH